MKAEFGEEVFNTIYEICQFADKADIWINNEYSMAHQLIIERLKNTYAFLTEELIRRLVTMASYSWK